MKKIAVLAIILSSITFITVGCDKKEEASALVSAPQKIKNIELAGVDGTKLTMTDSGKGFKIEELKDKTTLLVFFATWCPPCKAEIPHLTALQEKYKNDFAVVAVLVEEGKTNEEVKAFMSEHKVNYFVANSPSNMQTAQTLGVRGFPTMFMFDKNGQRVAYYPGAVPGDIIEQDLLKTLGK